MEINQCDGCMAGKPVDSEGFHRMGEGIFNVMACQKERYDKSPSA